MAHWLLCVDDKIAGYGEGTPPNAETIIDADGCDLLPGFIDIHVHGGMGYDTMDATPEALHEMAQFYAKHGVTGFLATTWTDSRERVQAALENIAANMGRIPGGATLLGAHLEGPYLNPAKCGAQNTKYIRRADNEEAAAFLDTGVIKIVSLAPEYEESLWLIDECKERGIITSAAHTNATYEQMMHAVERGLRHTTHTFNAMSGFHHREPGVAGAAMSSREIRCELICDNIHVHPAAMKTLLSTKRPHGVIIITDAVRVAGLPDGEYSLDERKVIVKDGAVRLSNGSLAGSTLTMDKALMNFIHAHPFSTRLAVATPNAAFIPARALGLSNVGTIRTGYDADLILMKDGEVRMTIIKGEIVHRKGI